MLDQIACRTLFRIPGRLISINDIISWICPELLGATYCLVDTWWAVEEATIPRTGPAHYDMLCERDPWGETSRRLHILSPRALETHSGNPQKQPQGNHIVQFFFCCFQI